MSEIFDSKITNPVHEDNSLQTIPAVMTVEELAQLLRIGRNNAYALVKAGEIPSRKVGRQIRIASDDVYRYLHNG